MQVITGFALLGALWFGVHALLWGLANTLDTLALGLHRAAESLRRSQTRRTRELSQRWVTSLERGLAPPAPQDEAFLRARGIRTDDLSTRGYTGE